MASSPHPWTAPPLDYYYEDEEGWEEAWGNRSGVCESWAVQEDWEASFWLLPALYLLVFVLGLSGNGLVLLTVWRGGGGRGGRRRRWADTYLAHLALADLAFVVTLPLWAASTAQRFHWPFGAALCKASSYLALLNMLASAFCLAALSLERYLALARSLPCSERPSARPRTSRALALAAVWLLAALLALPALLLRDTREAADGGPRIECDMDFSRVARSPEEEARWLAALSLATSALGFLLPLLLMALCYCALGLALRRHFRQQPPKEEQGRRRLLRILVALVGVFAACWLPFHLLKALYVLHWVGLLHLPCALHGLVLRLHPYATCLAYVNSCLNPFLYAFFDARFRARARALLGVGRKACTRAGGPQAGSVSSTLSGQTQKSELPSLMLGTKV